MGINGNKPFCSSLWLHGGGRQVTSSENKWCYLDHVIWYYLSAQPIISNIEVTMLSKNRRLKTNYCSITCKFIRLPVSLFSRINCSWMSRAVKQNRFHLRTQKICFADRQWQYPAETRPVNKQWLWSQERGWWVKETRPKQAYGRQGLAGSWGQNTDQAGTFGVFS